MSYCQIYQTNSNPEAREFVLLTTAVILSKSSGISTATVDKPFVLLLCVKKIFMLCKRIALDWVSLWLAVLVNTPQFSLSEWHLYGISIYVTSLKSHLAPWCMLNEQFLLRTHVVGKQLSLQLNIPWYCECFVRDIGTNDTNTKGRWMSQDSVHIQTTENWSFFLSHVHSFLKVGSPGDSDSFYLVVLPSFTLEFHFMASRLLKHSRPHPL